MIVIRAASPEHFPWIAERAHVSITPQLRALEAMDEESGQILAMVAYDGWMPNLCQMHVAVAHSFPARRFLRAAFGIPFIELERDLVVGWVLGTNEKALELDRRLGFRETHRIKDGWDKGVDLVLFEMRKDECKWLRKAVA
jgi:hypothetical protein